MAGFAGSRERAALGAPLARRRSDDAVGPSSSDGNAASGDAGRRAAGEPVGPAIYACAVAEAEVERFAPNGGQVTGALALLIAAAMVVIGVVDWSGAPHWVPALGVLVGALTWATTLRPRVLVTPGTLVLRNAFSTTRIPLAAVEEVAVRQVMAVRVGDARYVCSGAGRSLRQALKGSAAQRAREQQRGLRGELARAEYNPGMPYADFVESRLHDLIGEDRLRRGVSAYSSDLDALGAEVSREPAVLEIGWTLLGVLLVVAAIVL
jgi:hypothetical protein